MNGSLSATSPNEHDLFRSDDEPLVFEPGTVGWDEDDDHADLGTAQNDGNTLVKVTLFRGRDPTATPKPGVADGHRVLAQLGAGLFWVPPKGARVMVGFPSAFASAPGAAVIVSVQATSPANQFGLTRAKLDVGPDQDLVLKGKSVIVTDYQNRFLHVGPDGVMLQDEAGNGLVMKGGGVMIYVADGGDAKTVLQLTKDEMSLLQKSAGFLKLKGTKATLFSNGSACVVAGNVMLGAGATAATPALVGVAPPGTPSTSVFISP